ncbi:MAG: hypothetical protein AAFV62_06070 [Pseudomonadota bacterium]
MDGYDFAYGLFAATRMPSEPSAEAASKLTPLPLFDRQPNLSVWAFETSWSGPSGDGATTFSIGAVDRAGETWYAQYPFASGRIHGTYNSSRRVFEGVWRQDFGRQDTASPEATQFEAGELHWGEVQLVFDQRHSRFRGLWNIGGEGQTWRWRGERLRAPRHRADGRQDRLQHGRGTVASGVLMR